MAVQTPLEIRTSEKETQTPYGKYILSTIVKTMVLRNYILSAEQKSKYLHGYMSFDVILSSKLKTKYFIGLYPKQFWASYTFLGPAKFNLK